MAEQSFSHDYQAAPGRALELLAPAKNLEVGTAALMAGADAIYPRLAFLNKKKRIQTAYISHLCRQKIPERCSDRKEGNDQLGQSSCLMDRV